MRECLRGIVNATFDRSTSTSSTSTARFVEFEFEFRGLHFLGLEEALAAGALDEECADADAEAEREEGEGEGEEVGASLRTWEVAVAVWTAWLEGATEEGSSE